MVVCYITCRWTSHLLEVSVDLILLVSHLDKLFVWTYNSKFSLSLTGRGSKWRD